MITSCTTLPHSSLKKGHCASSYHRVREAIAAKFLEILSLDIDKHNGDILSKYCGYQKAWPLIKLFNLG